MGFARCPRCLQRCNTKAKLAIKGEMINKNLAKGCEWIKYFLNEGQRKVTGGTCYFEFQKGKFRNKFWLKDSLCLHADIFDSLTLNELFSDAIEDFCYYAPNEVSKEQWENLVAKSKGNEQWENVIEELSPWVDRKSVV